MSWFDDSPQLMIVSDLDFTMVDHLDPDNHSLLRFNALWEAYYRQDSLLVYSTGRSPTIYGLLRNERPLLTPDITIMSVGTEIMYGESMVRDNGWENYLDMKWNRDVVMEETAKFPELFPQSETEQRPHKVSFFVDKFKASEVIRTLLELLGKRGLDVKVIYSHGMALDILPKGAGKGEALVYLLKKFEDDSKLPLNTLVCGDSGNDVELFIIPEVYGVMVGNAQEELLQWHAENASNNPNIIHATERCAAGVIQAIGKFHLGPAVSPRDITDFQTCMVENFSPGFEVVKFYLFYERWRRAEVEKPEECMRHFKSILLPQGTFIHPSGLERSGYKCMDAIQGLYGDKEGTNYHVWIDKIVTAQIDWNSWLVKFYNWEASGKERRCCFNTVLLSSKGRGVDEPTWVHMNQIWLDDSEADDQNPWIL